MCADFGWLWLFPLTGLYRDGDGLYHWQDGQVTHVEQGFWTLDQPLGFQQGKTMLNLCRLFDCMGLHLLSCDMCVHQSISVLFSIFLFTSFSQNYTYIYTVFSLIFGGISFQWLCKKQSQEYVKSCQWSFQCKVLLDIGLQWTFKFMDHLTMKSIKIIFKEKLFETRVDLEKQLKSNFFLGNKIPRIVGLTWVLKFKEKIIV